MPLTKCSRTNGTPRGGPDCCAACAGAAIENAENAERDGRLTVNDVLVVNAVSPVCSWGGVPRSRCQCTACVSIREMHASGRRANAHLIGTNAAADPFADVGLEGDSSMVPPVIDWAGRVAEMNAETGRERPAANAGGYDIPSPWEGFIDDTVSLDDLPLLNGTQAATGAISADGPRGKQTRGSSRPSTEDQHGLPYDEDLGEDDLADEEDEEDVAGEQDRRLGLGDEDPAAKRLRQRQERDGAKAALADALHASMVAEKHARARAILDSLGDEEEGDGEATDNAVSTPWPLTIDYGELASERLGTRGRRQQQAESARADAIALNHHGMNDAEPLTFNAEPAAVPIDFGDSNFIAYLRHRAAELASPTANLGPLTGIDPDGPWPDGQALNRQQANALRVEQTYGRRRPRAKAEPVTNAEEPLVYDGDRMGLPTWNWNAICAEQRRRDRGERT